MARYSTVWTPPMTDADLPENWEELDFVRSWWLAMKEIGERVKAGEPLPDFFKSERDR